MIKAGSKHNVPEVVEVVEKTMQPNGELPLVDLTGDAVGIQFDKATQKYLVVQLKFDLESKQSEVVNLLMSTNHADEAHTQFKISVANLGILG